MNCLCGRLIPLSAFEAFTCDCGRHYKRPGIDEHALMRRLDALEARLAALESASDEEPRKPLAVERMGFG